MYFIGIDSSTSFNRLVCVDETLKPLTYHASATSDLSRTTPEVARDNLKRLFGEFTLLSNAKRVDCGGICIGASCAATPEGRSALESLFTQFAFSCPVIIARDMDIMLAAQTEGVTGIVIHAAAETRGYARDDSGKSYECADWGHLLDGGCSAFAIGLAALTYACMAEDGRAARGALYGKVLEHFGVKSVRDALPQIYSESHYKQTISMLPLTVKYAAEAGDENAKLIEENAAANLCLIARALIDKSGMDSASIVLSGSAVVHSEAITAAFTAMLKKDFPKTSVESLYKKPELGAAFVARAGVRLYEPSR